MSRNIDYENKLKKCNQCKQLKSFDNFYKSGMGLQYICKECVKENKKNKNAELIIKYKEVLYKIKETINYYAVEDEDYSKIYNQEEQEIMKLLEEIE